MQTQKKSKKSIQRQEKIKEVALKHFLSNGYEATNLKDIVKESGGSLSSIYEYYKNKENLFFEIIKEMIRKDEDNIKEIINTKNDTPQEIIFKLATYMVNLYSNEDNNALMKIVFSQIYNKNSNMITLMKNIDDSNSLKIMKDILSLSKDPFISNNADLISHMFLDFLSKHCFFRINIRDTKMTEDEKKDLIEFATTFFTRLLN